MYSYRQSTPPEAAHAFLPGSAQSTITCNLFDSSPDSVLTSTTHITTPPRSPIRQQGPTLLPKIRCQDQTTEPAAGPIRHHRNSSSSSFQNTVFPYTLQKPNSLLRRSTSPPNHNDLVSPVSCASAPSPFNGSTVNSALNSPIEFAHPMSRRPSLAHRPNSTSAIRGHSRSGSAGSIDESVIGRFGYPTYRRMPSYVTSMNVASVTATHMPSACSLEPVQQVSPEDFTAPAVQMPAFEISLPDSFPQQSFVPTTTIIDYLSTSNPSPSLVHRVRDVSRGMHTWFWWDVRNLRSWSDFDLNTLFNIDGFQQLLQIPISCGALPEPARINLQPETEGALQDIISAHFIPKINAALLQSQGDGKQLIMRSIKSPIQPGARQQPEFISNYPHDHSKTLLGDARGRVVGLVKSYDAWNTGMRREDAYKQIKYLKGLAHLHHVMREHGCRYGFIMTEIELLCVRCGGPNPSPNPSDPPVFGFLETAAPISLATHSFSATGERQLTAGLALWYLHMLAKENPLPGQLTWRMEVGGPTALSRQNCAEKDDWIPKPAVWEIRDCKRVRGWVWPEEGIHRKEKGSSRRRR